MQKLILWLSLIGKAAGAASTIDVTPINPKAGVAIFIVSSLLKDGANRLSEMLATVPKK